MVKVEGDTREYHGRHFCPNCGSSVFARNAEDIELHLGSLDSPDPLTPTYENWVVRRERWLPEFANMKLFQHGRKNE